MKKLIMSTIIENFLQLFGDDNLSINKALEDILKKYDLKENNSSLYKESNIDTENVTNASTEEDNEKVTSATTGKKIENPIMNINPNTTASKAYIKAKYQKKCTEEDKEQSHTSLKEDLFEYFKKNEDELQQKSLIDNIIQTVIYSLEHKIDLRFFGSDKNNTLSLIYTYDISKLEDNIISNNGKKSFDLIYGQYIKPLCDILKEKTDFKTIYCSYITDQENENNKKLVFTFVF